MEEVEIEAVDTKETNKIKEAIIRTRLLIAPVATLWRLNTAATIVDTGVELDMITGAVDMTTELGAVTVITEEQIIIMITEEEMVTMIIEVFPIGTIREEAATGPAMTTEADMITVMEAATEEIAVAVTMNKPAKDLKPTILINRIRRRMLTNMYKIVSIISSIIGVEEEEDLIMEEDGAIIATKL